MSAQPAYDLTRNAYEYDYTPSPDINVVPGRRAAAAPASSPAVLVVKVALAALVVFALLGVVRITLASAAVSTAIESKGISAQIEDAREAGNQLEVEQSTLSNPMRIKSAAEGMGMSAPSQTVVITLPADVVVTDDAGNLSLSGSVAAAAQE